MIIKIITLIAILSIILNTPISLMFILLTQTFLSILLINKIFKSSWFPIIIFLIIIGGLLIIFIYITRITSNEKFKWNFKIIIFIILILIVIFKEDIICEVQINEKEQYFILLDHLSIANIYNKTFLIITNLTLYLFITIIAINKIIKNFEGPLRLNK